jgi:hypothetical protein
MRVGKAISLSERLKVNRERADWWVLWLGLSLMMDRRKLVSVNVEQEQS